MTVIDLTKTIDYGSIKGMLTQKQEAFTLLTFKTNEPADAYLEIYKCKSKAVASAAATRLLKNVNVQALLEELNRKTEDDTIATVLERKQRLTEIIRGNNPIQAIAELNKMEKVYEAGILIDNRTQILVTPGMRALAAREMMEIREEETKLLNATEQEEG